MTIRKNHRYSLMKNIEEPRNSWSYCSWKMAMGNSNRVLGVLTVVLCYGFSQVGQYPELSQLLHSMPGRRKPLEHPDGPSRWPPMLWDRTQRPGVVSVAPRTSMPKMLDGPGRRSLDLPWTADGVWLQTLNGCLWVCIMFGYVWYMLYLFCFK